MNTFLIVGGLTALGVILILFRIGIRRVLRWGATVDILLSGSLAWFMANSIMGIISAVIAGIFITGFLLIARFVL